MNRDSIVRLVALALAGLVAWWVLTSTEWTEVEVDTPPKGEALRNPLFAAQLVLQNLGARVERHTGLDTLPPANARLLLDSRHWALFPERSERLRQWVEGGGHLVLNATLFDDDDMDWIPVVLAKRPPVPPAQRRNTQGCHVASEAAAPAREYRVCVPPYSMLLRAADGTTPTWQPEGPFGPEALRVAVGRGSVTLVSPSALMHNAQVLRPGTDHALLMASALQARRGAVVWIVAEEARDPLLRWAWQRGWIAVLLALAALAAWLWRSAVRFGPMGVVPPPERRSMVEQVLGTGAFLRHHGPAALHAAQVRALREMARRRLPGFERLGRVEAAEAIGKATGLRASDLQQALQPLKPGAPLAAGHLELLELARRRLEASFQATPAPTP